MEKEYDKKLQYFVKAVCEEQPEIIALQEVNQSCNAMEVPLEELIGYYPCDAGVVVREDNHVWNIVKQLRQKGVRYYFTWLPIKKGYDKYDEGLAIMSRCPIAMTDVLLVSNINDYNNWKTRKILGICTEGKEKEWFYSVHYGWWSDKEEPFSEQWKKTDAYMERYDTVWLLGDFNSPAQVRHEGYDMIARCAWEDSFLLAEEKDSGITVGSVIDGWKEKITDTDGMRIDQIWCNRKIQVKRTSVVFNGEKYPVVSDHYGVIIEVAE